MQGPVPNIPPNPPWPPIPTTTGTHRDWDAVIDLLFGNRLCGLRGGRRQHCGHAAALTSMQSLAAAAAGVAQRQCRMQHAGGGG